MIVRRDSYVQEVRGFYESDLIKIFTGVRRCGKSVIMEQIADEIREKSDNVLYLDFDDRAVTSFIQSWSDIVEYVAKNRKDGLCYVFLDEVQEIDGWQFACRSLRRENCSVFITGSNSKLLSKEFTKELSGRYVAFRIRPFVYKELAEYAQQLGKEMSVTDYLVWGGFPKRIEFATLDEQRRYINDLDQTIVENDIINRYKIRQAAHTARSKKSCAHRDFPLPPENTVREQNAVHKPAERDIIENKRNQNAPNIRETVVKWQHSSSYGEILGAENQRWQNVCNTK